MIGLPRDAYLILDDSSGRPGDEYIQVLLRQDGVYQLEFRAGSPAEHYQTLTVSAEKVHTAFNGWRLGH